MGHELRPRNGSYPSAAEVAARLAKEFAFVKTDEEEGIKRARAKADWIEHAPARIFLGHHKEALEGAARLKNLAPGESLVIEFGDGPTKTQRIVVMPNEPIKFGYASDDDERASKDLVERCARALDSDVLLFYAAPPSPRIAVRLAVLLLLVGVILSPLRAVAAVIPALYDARRASDRG